MSAERRGPSDQGPRDPGDHAPRGRDPHRWATRPERPGGAAAIRDVLLAAFPTAAEADLVDALRADGGAWREGLSLLALDAEATIVAHALLTRAFVGEEPVLALAPCATLPARQGRGAGSAAIRAALAAGRAQGENTVVVLGHPAYYPRFGFTPAADAGITAPFDAPEDAFLALALDPSRPLPRGELRYPAAFGV
jgi:predicted N-acetyltransferase YhbS